MVFLIQGKVSEKKQRLLIIVEISKATLKNNLKEETYTLKNQRLKITQLKKAYFINVNELKLTEAELF